VSEQAHSVLVVDDEPAVRNALKAVLEQEFRIVLASDGASAIEALRTDKHIEVMLLDMVMPGMHGMEVLRHVRDEFTSVEVIILSALQSIETVIEAINLGAFDYVGKPFVARELALIVNRAIELRTLKRELHQLRETAGEPCAVHMIGAAPVMLGLRHRASELGRTREPFLVKGERGSGRELFARVVHTCSEYRTLPFSVMRCLDLARQQTFRALVQNSPGVQPPIDPVLLGLPKRGFVLFKDACELDTSHQDVLVRLIQTLQEDGVQCAATAPQQTITGETGPDGSVSRLERSMGRNIASIPPLRERHEDIKLLAEFFLMKLRTQLNAAAERFHADAIEELETYPWPGNVRELHNFIERILILHSNVPVIERIHLPDEIGATAARALSATDFIGKKTLKEAVNELEKRIIVDALRRAGGVQTRASQILGTTRRILRYRMQHLGIE